MVNLRGRMVDAEITDVTGDVLHYSYSFRGVDYMASQDVSDLRAQLPRELGLLAGPATIKFMQDNPFNSILIAEEWSGISAARQKRGDSK